MSELNSEQPEGVDPGASIANHAADGETAGGLTVPELQDWLRDWVSAATGVPADQISDDRPMEELGLSSRDAVALAADVEDKTGVILTATVAYNHPTIAMLAKRIVEGDPDEGLDADADRFWERERDAADDIAIVGFSTRFPKAGHTPESTWERSSRAATASPSCPTTGGSSSGPTRRWPRCSRSATCAADTSTTSRDSTPTSSR